MQSDNGESNMHPPKARVFFPAAACTGDNSGIWRTSCGAACTRGRLFRATRRYLRIRTSPIPARRKADASERGRISRAERRTVKSPSSTASFSDAEDSAPSSSSPSLFWLA